jgi:hypothetical protein
MNCSGPRATAVFAEHLVNSGEFFLPCYEIVDITNFANKLKWIANAEPELPRCTRSGIRYLIIIVCSRMLSVSGSPTTLHPLLRLQHHRISTGATHSIIWMCSI